MVASLVRSVEGVSSLATTTCAFPTATAAGNLIVLRFAADDYNGTPNAGWQQSSEMEQQTFHGSYLWWRISTGETSFQYTIGSASVSAWVIEEWSGIDATPYDVSGGQFIQTSTNNYTTKAIVPSTGPRVLMASMGGSLGSANLSAQSWGTWLNSFTGGDSIGTSAGATNDIVGAAYRRVTGDGVTSFSTGATCTNILQSRSGLIIAFKEATASGTALTASNVTTTSPTIGAPSLVRITNISASSLTTTAPTIAAGAFIRFVLLSASSLTTTAATLGSQSVGVINNLSPSSFTETAVSFTSPTVGYKEGLTAASLTPSSVTFTQAAGAIFGVMTAAPLSTTALTFTDATFNQTQALSPSSVTTTSVSFTSVDLVRRVALSPSSLTTTAPSLGSGTIALFHALATDGLVNGDPAVTWIYALSASNVTTSIPTIGAATFNQSQSFIAASFTRQSTEITAPTFMGIAHMMASEITTSSPDIGVPDAVSIIHMDAANVETTTPTFTDVDINQRQALGASVLSTGPPTFPNLQIFLAGEVASANLVLSNIVFGAPAFVERVSHLDAASFTSAAPTISSPALHQSHVLSADVITTSVPELASPTVAQTHAFAAIGYAVDVVIGEVSFSQTCHIGVSDYENGSPELPNIATSGVGTLHSVGINKTSPTIGAPSFAISSGYVAQNLVLSSPQFTATQFQSQSHLIAANVLISTPVIATPNLTSYDNLVSASFTRSEIVLTAPIVTDYIPPLQAVFTVTAPTIGAPQFSQKQLLVNVVLAQGYPNLPSPLFMTTSPINMVHKARIVGVPTHKKATIVGVARRGAQTTISGRPLPPASRNI